MNEFDDNILVCDRVICENIALFDSIDRGFLSQNILSNLRNLVEAIDLKAYSCVNAAQLHDYDDICRANGYVAAKGELRFLHLFHEFLQSSVSHYIPDKDNAERLMLKYYHYLIKTKSYVKKAFGLDILQNITSFPVDTDNRLYEYYEQIFAEINRVEPIDGIAANRYYVQKSKPIYLKSNVFYEITLTLANDKANKFDRFIVFSRTEIPNYYAIKISFVDKEIQILGKKMPIKIINDYEVSVRPCEWQKFQSIFSPAATSSTGKEYLHFMKFLTKTGFSLVEVIDFQDEYYNQLKIEISRGARAHNFFDVLDKCRELSINNSDGINVVRYLLLHLNNKIIKSQQDARANNWLSYLYIRNESKPFDMMPYATSLAKHNTQIGDLFECINSRDREHELLARRIKDNTEFCGQLYTSKEQLDKYENVPMLISKYNNKLHGRHRSLREINIFSDNLYINGYKSDTEEIIRELLTMTGAGINGYRSSVEAWLVNEPNIIADDEKKEILKTMFETTNLALIYGAAGTGKSTLIGLISNMFADLSKVYLANTNPAVENMRRKVKVPNSSFRTIASTKSLRNGLSCDILFIDECSTVSNSDMLATLQNVNYKLLVLVGDVYQIESITFGNWFHLAKRFVPSNSVHELTKTYRTNDNHLLTLWNKVRRLDEKIIEYISNYHYAQPIDETIFNRSCDDEIVLCLNYDGLYGINNINRFLQNNNPNRAVEWNLWRYKIGDPVIFSENERFSPVLYNNLKGWIRDIKIAEDKIIFDIEIESSLNELQTSTVGLTYVNSLSNGHTVIRFHVRKYMDPDGDDDILSDRVVPFQIAYAISIHKAQGLEYQSVKVVITNEIEDLISHNIFYTAITRAKEQLKIFWSPETENKIISGLKLIYNEKDVQLFSKQTGLKIIGTRA